MKTSKTIALILMLVANSVAIFLSPWWMLPMTVPFAIFGGGAMGEYIGKIWEGKS